MELMDEQEMIRKAYFDASQASGLPPQWIYDFAFNLLAAHNAGARGEPIDMLLFCPKCGAQHIDAPEKEPGRLISGGPNAGRAISPRVTWDNPPHRSHLCHSCGTIWRPADVPTNGVAAIKTHGKNDYVRRPPAATAVYAAHSAGAQEPVAIPDGWMLVKRERIEEIRKHAHTEFVNSYLGRNLYDERLSRQNERIGEEALSNIRDVLSCIGLDEEDRIAAHPQPITDAARDAKRYQWLRAQHEMQDTFEDSEGFTVRSPAESAWTVFRPGRITSLEPVSCIPGELDKAIDAEIERLARAKGA